MMTRLLKKLKLGNNEKWKLLPSNEKEILSRAFLSE